jgi:hypothetical protein
MVKKILFIGALGLVFSIQTKAQNTYLQLGEYEYHLLDRLETKSGRLSDRLFFFNIF